jgi:hypothetical protein
MRPEQGTQSTGVKAVSHRRRRLSRTLAPGRFRDYRSLLRLALSHDYQVVSLERFLADGGPQAPRVLILRHDVDQHPASALRMARIERDLGLRSTWYLRWRTADPQVIDGLRAAGGEIGLHYETLTRRTLTGESTDLDSCRAELREEIASFAALFGPLRSVCAHGDTRAPGVRNLQLLEGQDLSTFGVRWDANLSIRAHRLAVWLTDRSAPDGAWIDGLDPRALLRRGASPIQCLAHPNNWVSGLDLWMDRGLAAALPHPRVGRRARVRRSRSDAPPGRPR